MDVITNNIWMGKYRPVGITKWGKEVDRNLFSSEGDRTAFVAQGCDANSISGDPMFVDPEKGDYRVKEGSPAFKIGFVNFPMDQFGVRKPELKAIARTPLLLTVKITGSAPGAEPAPSATWLGASVAALTGEEFSAFGVSKEDGGIHVLKVLPQSQLAKAGIVAGDLVQSINGMPVKTIEELRKATESGKGKPLQAGYVRNQQEQATVIQP